jgi:ComF family protein
MRKALARFAAAAADLLFPPECLLCQRPLPPPDAGGDKWDAPRDFCAACVAELTAGLPRCPRCGATCSHTLESADCEACRGHALPWRGAVIFATYGDLVREAVLRAKRASGESVALALGRRLGDQVHAHLRAAPPPDLVVPVPMHWRRRVVRGASSAHVLAAAVAERLQRPARAWLRRTRATSMQNTLPPQQRPANVAGAFLADRRLRGKRVLVVDDVITTGATVAACTHALLAAGALEVYLAAVAKAERSDHLADDDP